MKLLNYTSSWFALILFLILTIWATVFYVNMLDEIYDSMDDGLENQKLLVVQKAAQDSSVLRRKEFEDGYYKIREISLKEAENYTDTYLDTLIYTLNEKEFEPFRMLQTAFHINGKYYEMRLITSMVEEDDLIADLLLALIFLYLGLMASILILNNFLLRRIWKSFYVLLDRLKSFRLNEDSDIEVPASRIVEFQLLNESVMKLLKSNVQAYNNQKQFIENAAHELQTPLAISLNKLELLVENSSLKEEELVMLSGIMDNLKRLTRLNKSLLLLSKINNRQFPLASEINFNQQIKKALEDFSDLAAHRDINICFDEKGECQQKMNLDLAQILINNLIKNAIVHNNSSGFIRIEAHANSIIIENSGKASPLDPKKIFERFHKGENTGSSTGLGLSIVKAIADMYNFSVRYEYREKHIIQLNF